MIFYINPVGIAVTNSKGWIANGNGSLTYCASAPNNDPVSWSSCAINTPQGYSTNATNLVYAGVLNIPNTAGVLYTANTNSNSISACIVDSFINITQCINAEGSGFNKPMSISANLQSLNPHALITNSGNNTVSLCQLDPASFLLSNCVTTGSNFSQPSFIYEDSTGFTYVTNRANNSVTVCKNTNGLLSNCVSMPYGFSQPSSIINLNFCA